MKCMNLLKKNKFNRLGIFTYSHEEGTHSHSLVDDVPETLKRKRSNLIMGLQQKISFVNNKKYIGKKA